MKRRPYVAPLSEQEIMEFYPLMVSNKVESIDEEDNNADAKNSHFFEEDNNSSTNPWDNDLFK